MKIHTDSITVLGESVMKSPVMRLLGVWLDKSTEIQPSCDTKMSHGYVKLT